LTIGVLEAFLWGLFAASSLVVGALVVRVHDPHPRALGLVMGFGAGVLLSAVSFELVEEAVTVSGGLEVVALGFFTGALAFFAGDILIGRIGYAHRKDIAGAPTSAGPLAIVLGAALDGIPESAVIGLTLLSGQIGVTMLVAVFVSNVPESIAASSGLTNSGWPFGRVVLLWSVIAVASGISSLAGYGLLDQASSDAIAFVLAFAGGAILTMLSTSMMPEAYEHAGRAVGLMTTFGFAVAFAINSAEG
jgi:zinc transporter, ZIP family